MNTSVECPRCGTVNALGSVKCWICGGPMSHEHVGAPGSRVCAHCGQPLDDGTEICNACTRPARDVIISNLPKDVSPVECVHWSEKPATAGRSARVVMAGILIMMAGALGIGQSVVTLSPDLSSSLMDTIEGVVPWSGIVDDAVAEYVILQAWVFIAGLLAIAGGVFAITETRFELAIMGGIFGILAVGFLMGSFLGLVGVLLLAVSRKGFFPEC